MSTVYTEVTETIIAALEEGTVPWRKTWRPADGAHRNPASGTVYRGINPFLLDLTAARAGYGDPRWLTFKQARDRAGSVRKGERSTLVVFWKMLRGKDDETGQERTIPLLRHYRVFNVAQVNGLDLEPLPEPAPFEPIERAADIVAGMPNAPRIGHGGSRAFYAPVFDAVQLPAPEQFERPEHYYSTAFHELAHATGHESRLKRDDLAGVQRFGDEAYSREELTAEMAAAMLCGVAGISQPTIANSAAYIAGWVRALRDDRKLVISAAGRAQRAADYVLGETREV